MKYGSVCSGVEAASLAWLPLGWEAAWFSEIEPFPCAVLRERFPSVPNLGDMTKIQVEKMENGDQKFTGGDGTVVVVSGGLDLLVGGTPCQGFSVAGKRAGLRDERSRLAMAYVRLLDIVRPRWFVWENVPGVLSNNGGRDFRAFLAAIDGVGYSLAWRVLDAQYTRVDGFPRAIPQRRRRVFVVGTFGTDWQRSAQVLFDEAWRLGNTPPRRYARDCLAGGAESGAGVDCYNGKGGKSGDVSPTLQANLEKMISNQTPILAFVADDVSGTIKQNAQSCGSSSTTLRGNGDGATANTITGDHASRITDYTPVVVSSSVRRLMPVECERLMGFPDNWTRISWRGRPAEECPDAPRYKACGNSMCVNCMEWIGRRIEKVEKERSENGRS